MTRNPGMMNRRHFVSGAAALGMVGFAAGCGRAGNRPLSAVDTHPQGYPTVEAVRHFSERVSQLTDGRVTIRLYPGGQLGQEKDSLELTIFGGIDFNRINLAPLNSIAPLTRVPALPFLFRSIEHMHAAMDGAPGQQILASLEPYGLVGLCFYDSGARSFYNTQHPITTPQDMKGLKIRVQNSDLFVAMVRALGANPTPMPFGEVYQALVQGVVDGAENNWPSFENTRHYEAAGHYSLTRHVMAPEVFVMSKHSWDKLSGDDQRSIRQAAKESVPVMRKLWADRVNKARDIVLASGVNLVEQIDTKPFSDLMGPVWAPVLADKAASNLVADIIALDPKHA